MAEKKTTKDYEEYSDGEKKERLQEGVKLNTEENKATIEDAKQHTVTDDKVDFLVDPVLFSMPTMGDFYLGAVDGVYLKKIDELANTKLEGKGDGKDAAFYTESPPIKEMGETEDAYYLKARVSISDDDIDQGFADGRTLNVNINDVSGKDEAVANLKKQLLSSMQGYGSIEDHSDGNTYFTLRLVGLGCPATPKWAFEYDYKNEALNTQKKVVGDVVNSSQYLFVNGLHDTTEELTFVKIGGKWREATFYSQGEKTSSFRWLMDSGDEAYENARQAAKNLQELIAKNGGEIYFLMDKGAISKDSNMSSASMGNVSANAAYMGELSYSVQNAPAGCAYKTGYARTHQEAFRRFSGVAYVKADGKFCNLAKMALTDKTNEELYPDASYDGTNKELFEPQRYDREKQAYADAYFEVLSELDDRRKIQKEIFNQEFKDLNDWTVTIGDVTLFIPPTNIQCISTVQNEHQPMIRAKGSATKGGHRVTRAIQMELFFNEDRGINGYSKDITLPNGATLNYKLNGLRQLIAQFKFTPFLPIENEYINNVLNIDAVLFSDITISHVTGYPRLYQANLTLMEFDYAAYMPEIYNFAAENDYNGNIFAASINWAVMRYYYQRCIRKGDTLAASGYRFNTDEYNSLLVGNRTTLIPMSFKSNEITFYLANKDYMDEMAAARMELLNGNAKPVIDFGKEEISAMKKLGTLSKAIKEAVGSEEFRAALNDANKNSKGNTELQFATRAMGTMFGSRIEDSQRPGKVREDFYGTGIKNMVDGVLDGNKNFDYYINKPVSVIRNYVEAVNETLGDQGYLVSDVRIAYETQNAEDGGKDIYIGLSIECSTDYLSDDDAYFDLKQDASNYVGSDKDTFFKDHRLFVSLKAHFNRGQATIATGEPGSNHSSYDAYTNTTGFEFDMDSTDMKFLEFCENADELEKEAADIKERRSNVNLNQLDSLVYDKYDVGTTYIQNFKATLTNHLSNVHINNISGTSAQYLGGEDTTFLFEIKTTSKEAAANLCALPMIAAQYARDYHMILPYYPLRVDSELTGFLGVNEVVIDTAQVSASNEETGVYTVQLSLRSVDRTLRNREAMERIELHNSGYNRGEARQQNRVRTFFEIQDILNQAELYPDLELPTLKEMNKLGYEFVRYKFQDGRKYVDPDFYFIYPQVLMSQVIREMFMNGMSNGIGNTTLTDKAGASIDITPAEGKGISYSNGNDAFKKQQEELKKAENAATSQKRKELKENLRNKKDNDNLLLLNGERDQWAVCEDITPMFLEKKYRKEYEAFEAYCVANGLDVATEAAKAPETASAEIDSKEAQKTGSEKVADQKTDEKAKSDAASKNQGQNQAQNQETKKAEDKKEAAGNTQDAKGKETTKDTTGKEKESSAASAKEGQWVAYKLQTAAEASSQIMQYLEQKPIAMASLKAVDNKEAKEKQKDKTTVDAIQGKNLPNGTIYDQANKEQETKKQEKGEAQKEPTEAAIKSAVLKFLGDGDVQEIFTKLNIKHSDEQFVNVFKDILYAAACSATAEKEYAGKKTQKGWRPDKNYIAYINRNQGQEINGGDLAQTVDEGVENGIRFGCFNIRMYTRSELLRLTKTDVEAKDGESINESLYLLDPYYRSDPERIAEYKRSCIVDPSYAAFAFLRIMLYWMAQLIDEKAIPTITNDVLRGTVKNELKIQMKQAEKGAADMSSSVQTLNENISFFNKRTYAIDAGKIFASTVMALTDGNGTVLGHIKTNNYRALNAYVQSCSNPITLVKPGESNVLATRKLILALVGQGRIDSMNAIGSSPSTPATECYQRMMERKYIAAAEDPNQYVPHSCHDMVVNDARGRMLRAFPTFYMVFIDEGREIGQWKLHDNFYTTNALLSMQIVKSRKIAADTAIISMSNFYQSYTTESDDFIRQRIDDKTGSGVSWGDAFESIWSPNDYAKKQEAKRQAMPEQVRMRIREGARMHIRLGYGSSANMLPIVFNGVVAEVSAEDTVEIIGQGDGIELLNPITDIQEAHEANNESGWNPGNWDVFNNSATTKEIMKWLLTRSGGWISDLAKDSRLEGLINCNPYGLYHFGSPDLKTIHKSGEICQNIFESYALPIWGDAENKDAPEINIQMFQKTIWDVANICKSVMPDFICGVAPFGFRSTLFIGDPRYYYAYDYEKTEGGGMLEKRKPYQQYHIYTSYSDIIGNGIRASSRKMKTAAIGMYEVDFGTGSMQQQTDPIMADIDIYPEYQKTMIVDTRLFAKGIPILSGIEAPLADWVDRNLKVGDEKGNHPNNAKLAKTMALSALIDSMRDMYCGDMVVLGDATVKPHDRIYVNDTYEGFKGQATVKEVVHNFNVNDGFTTSISPDCIVKADAKYELGANNTLNGIGSFVAAAMGFALYNAAALMGGKVPSLKKYYEAMKDSKLGGKARNMAKNVAEKAGNLAKKIPGAGKVEKIVDKAKGAKDAAKKLKAIRKAKAGLSVLRGALAGTGVGIPLVAAEMAVSYIITQAVSSIITDKLRSIKAVTIFPLERFCIPYTAGIAGSKGLVVSEHAPKNISGGFKAMLADLIPENSMVFDALSAFFLTDEASQLIDKFKRDNGMVDSSGNPTMTNGKYTKQYLNSLSMEEGGNDYRGMMISPRIDLSKSQTYADPNANLTEEQKTDRETYAEEVSKMYDEHAMMDTDRWFIDPKLQNNVSVSGDERIKPYIEEDFFYIIHEQPTLNKQDKKVITQVITTSTGEEDYVKAIVDKGDDGSAIYDIPMLNPDAMNILYEIIRRAKNHMPAAKASDQVEAYEKAKGSYVVLKSALRVGDKTSFSPTGFSFILQGTDDAYNAIIKAAEELTVEVKEDSESSSGLMNESIFAYTYGKENGIENNEVLFTAYPPKKEGGRESKQKQEQAEEKDSAKDNQQKQTKTEEPGKQ